nr:uncharacterized protein LOC113815300 [Penaeus vannamei]
MADSSLRIDEVSCSYVYLPSQHTGQKQQQNSGKLLGYLRKNHVAFLLTVTARGNEVISETANAVRMLLFVLLALGHATQGLPNVDDVTIPPWVTTTTEASRSLGPVDLDVRLPRSIKPLHYVVKLQPFINGNFSIVGYMEVEMEVLEPTSNITLSDIII